MTKITESDVMDTLKGVMDPELANNVVDLGMVKSVDIDPEGIIHIGIALTIAECPMRDQIKGDVERRVGAMEDVKEVVVTTSAMTKRQRSELMSVARHTARENAEPTQIPPTTRVVVVASGKGGVGKSSISNSIAVGLADLGFEVGLLDADIWGFSQTRLMGVNAKLVADEETRLIQPIEVDKGLKMVSTGLIADDEETALMWRGLMLSKALEQFLRQVEWGEMDYLVVDMPPGTGDVQMALSRMLPQAEMIVVTSPQVVAQKVAKRVADMARRSFMPVLGVVENMAEFVGSDGAVHTIFGSGGGQKLADDLAVPLLASIPLDPAVSFLGDKGFPVVRSNNPAGKALAALAQRVTEVFPPAEAETCTGRIAKLFDELPEIEAV